MPSKLFCRSASEGMQSVILPSWNSGFEQTNSTRKLTFLGAISWWARVDYASRASKKAPQGLFSPPDCSAGRCCSNPPLRVKLKMPDKTKNQRIFYAGLFGGRGWIRTTEAESSRFTVCPHWPLGNTPIFFCVRRADCLYILPRAKQFVNHLQQILSQFLHQSLQQTRPMEKPPGNQCSRAVFLGAGDRS